MCNRFLSIPALVLLAMLAFGCSGSGLSQNPIAPPPPQDTTQAGLTANSEASTDCDCGHWLWGFWQGAFNSDTGEVELVSLREALFHLNVTGRLQAPYPPRLNATILNFNKEEGLVGLDLTITHPFPNTNLRGFDVKGILMGSGATYEGQVDSTLRYPTPVGFRVLNADGYSRWWNASEFVSGGLYGFVPGDLGIKVFVPQSTLNGYKYFADVLEATDPVVPNVNPANRGTFSTDEDPAEVTRNYELQFPLNGMGDPIWLFQYAIDASWAPPTGSSPPPKPIEDYPIEANSPEAFHIEVSTDGTTAWYQDDLSNGGEVVLELEVFDWGATSNADGINGEIASITIESPTLFDTPVVVDLTPGPGSQSTSGIYTATVAGVHPSSLEDQEVLIMVNSSEPSTYAPPISGPSYPDGASLAAFKLVEIPIIEGPPIITVESPNGGESMEAGTDWEITWTSEGPAVQFVKIEYSQEDAYYTEIVASTENDGSYEWDPLPNIEDDEVRIIITAVGYPMIFDTSDEFFEITITPDPQIIVTTPNGGETWYEGDGETITWDTIGPVGPAVTIGYTVSDGTVVEIASGEANDNSYEWDPIPGVDSSEVRIVITDEFDPLVTDSSDEYFTISRPEINITIPNGGEIWTPGGDETIRWENLGDVGFEVSIDYTISDGDPVNIVAITDNDGTYQWVPIPEIDSEEVRIVVTSVDDPSITDESDEYFIISSNPPPTIIVTQPNGGEIWLVDGSGEITWESYGLVGFEVRIDYTVDDGPAENIISMTNNDGSFDWDPIPEINSEAVKILVSSILDPGVNDDSDDYFTILTVPGLEITSPNGGEVLTGLGMWDITWKSSGPIMNVDLWYSQSDGDGHPYQIEMNVPNTGTYTWDPVENIDTSEGSIRIISSDDPLLEDYSDDFFTINFVVQSITVISPNGGEELIIGGDYTIEWSSENIDGNVNIGYSVSDTGLPIWIVADTENDGSFEWEDISWPPSTTARVMIASVNYTWIADSSDNHFTIAVGDTLRLRDPNGGENLPAGGVWLIEWNYSGDITNVNLFLSTDSGDTYDHEIVMGAECTGEYLWDPVPDLDTDTCKVRIENTDDTELADESNENFSIHPGGPDMGWVPITGLTQIEVGPAVPNQDPEPADIGVFSNGASDDESRGMVCTQTDTPDITFSMYDNDYGSPVLYSWTFPEFGIPVHKFDAATNGSYLFVVNSNAESFPNDQVNDPMYCAFAAADVTNGDFSDEFWHLYGDTGDPDPDMVPWRRVADVSSGVTGGIDESTFFYLTVIADHPDQPQAHDGNILLSTWAEPYDQTGFTNWLIDSSTQGGGQGFVDDTTPNLMAFAVDDDTELVFDTEPALSFWVLGGDGRITSHLLAPTSGDIAIMDNQLDSDEYGTAIPVDIECAPAKEFDYSVSDPNPFNWLCVLLDNDDGTWSVGVWECDFLAGPPVEFHFIGITAPLNGVPLSLDVDGTDFEIHVLSDNGGTIELTVFEYIPE